MARSKRTQWDNKTNEAYPLFAFRTYGKVHKQKLSDEIEKVTELVNTAIGTTGKQRRKQDIIIEALERGLELIRQDAKRKK